MQITITDEETESQIKDLPKTTPQLCHTPDKSLPSTLPNNWVYRGFIMCQALCGCIISFNPPNLIVRYCVAVSQYPHFTDEKTEALKSKAKQNKTQTCQVMKSSSDPGLKLNFKLSPRNGFFLLYLTVPQIIPFSQSKMFYVRAFLWSPGLGEQ